MAVFDQGDGGATGQRSAAAPQPDARWGSSTDHLRFGQLTQDSTDEGAPVANRVDRNLDLSVCFETIERMLNPLHGNGLAGGRPPRSNHDVVALQP